MTGLQASVAGCGRPGMKSAVNLLADPVAECLVPISMG
jgi:hypothetical protein